MKKDSKIYISGHRGLAGSAIFTTLKKQGYADIVTRAREELDLTDSQKVADFFYKESPEYVFHCAARVGSMSANIKYSAEFLYQNLAIQNNVIHQAYVHGAKKLIFFGSNCAYPRLCPQPMKEEYIMTGPLEPTNEAYGIAKIAGINMCQNYNHQYNTNFLSLIPASIYGPNDHFEVERSHVIPFLIKRFHEAKIRKEPQVTISDNPKKVREFLYVDDLANASIYAMNNPINKNPINIGTGENITIKNLSELIRNIVGYKGKIIWSKNVEEGMPKKILDVKKIHALGWKHGINLKKGLLATYHWYLANTK